jgi:hypothetical protein
MDFKEDLKVKVDDGSSDDQQSMVEKINAQLNARVNMEVEKRCEQWLVAAQGVDWVEKFQAAMRKNAVLTSLVNQLAFFVRPTVQKPKGHCIGCGVQQGVKHLSTCIIGKALNAS